MNRHWPALLIAFTITAVAAAQRPDASAPVEVAVNPVPAYTDDIASFIIFKDQAFFVGSPILIAGPKVTSASWSPTGQFMVLEQSQQEHNVLNIQSLVKDQKPIPPQDSMSVYSLPAAMTIEVMRFPVGSDHHEEIDWIADSDKALVVASAITRPEGADSAIQEQKLYVLDASNTSMKEFSPWEGDEKPYRVDIMPSPTQPLSFIVGWFSNHTKGDDGKDKISTSNQVYLMTVEEKYAPVKVSGSNPLPLWSTDGTRAYVMAHSIEGPRKAEWFNVSLTNGTTTLIDRPREFYMGGKQGGLLTIREVNQTSTNGKTVLPINALWLETADPDCQNRLLLAGDASMGDVNKTLDCASYISQGSLFLRPISEVPLKRYTEAKVAWNHAQALNQVRGAGLAAIMCASDYDDVFPSSKDKIDQILGPYVRDGSMLVGFVYTYPGGPASAILNPSATQIGYVDCGDGRAVVYADGHAKFIPN
jgi:hypothetical protein